ncbi:MAG: PQQ-dependent sugar dehydrogenase [Krumholzibacteria bacterium]|nr:PQQ-dependent sugar dehydrogenase [Candidatus Krumholzibacteria bacterium]
MIRSVFFLLSLLVALPAAAQVASERLITGLDRPLRLVAPPGSPRLFVVERSGTILVYNQDGTFRDLCLDIGSLISLDSERGLLGLAFPPDHATTRRFYVSYTDLGGDSRVVRYTMGADPDRADPASAQLILQVSQPQANHNGGHIEFGPDGLLYIGFGDGGGSGDPQNNAQNDQVLLGKLLRLDVSGAGPGYAIPASNPFVGLPPRDEIWAKGLRNPWCWSFDRETGDLYIADVGQSELEEINVQPAGSDGGENYGWRLMEGTACFNPSTNCPQTGLTLPVHEYGHGGSPFRCSITGGYVYRGSMTQLRGRYFFADFCSAQVWSMTWTPGQGATDVREWTDLIAPAGGFQSIAGFGQDGFGELYVLDYDGGDVYRLVPTVAAVPGLFAPQLGQNVPNPFNPSTDITFTADPAGGSVRLAVYDVAGRLVRVLADGADPEGTRTVTWDGTDAQGRTVAAGVYHYRLEQGGRIATRKMVLLE